MQPWLKFRQCVFPSLIFIVSITAAASGRAQQPVPISEEVVVTATRFREPQQDLPVGVTVITKEQIRNSTAATVPELLMQNPGIHVRDNSGSPNWQVDMRGFGITGDQNTLVLLDGQRISENELASVNWAAIPLAAIERIEIMRGSGAVLYGGGATGGTINIITKAPQKNSKSAFLSGGYSSYATGDYRAGFNFAGERVGMVVNGSHLETDNYRDSNRLRQQNAQADLRYAGERGTLYAKFGADDQQLLFPGALTEAQIAVNRRQAATPGDFSHTSGGRANVGGELRLGDAELALNAGYRGKLASSSFFAGFFNTSTQVNVMSLTPRAKIPLAAGGLKHTLVIGVDWDNWDYDSATLPPFASHRLATQRDAAWYAQTNTALGAATVLAMGVRAQRVNFAVNEIIGGSRNAHDRSLRAFEIAARHALNDTVAVYGKFGNSFRIPNVDENFNFFTAAVTLLEPQTSHDREIGAVLRQGRANYRLAFYLMDVSNEIHLDPVAFNNINLPPTRRYGFELEGKWSLAANLSAFANYTYAVAKFRAGAFGGVDVVDKDVPLVPRDSANLGVAWEFMPRTRLNAVANYVGEQIFDGDETNTFGRKMPSYTLVDLKLINETRGWLLSAGVKNLFNQKYFSYGLFTGFPTFIAYPAPERSLFFSAQYTYR